VTVNFPTTSENVTALPCEIQNLFMIEGMISSRRWWV